MSELQTIPTTNVSALNMDAFAGFLKERAPHLLHEDITLPEALVALRLATVMGNRVVPTLVGLYVFGLHPQDVLPQCGVVAVRFDGTDITSNVMRRESFDGPMPKLRSQAVDFVEQNSRAIVNQIQPDEQASEFPVIAVREAVTNALVHRDLRSGGPVAIRIFSDRVEIWSPGPPAGLQYAMPLYAKKGGVSAPRNPTVAALARGLGLVEQLGRGLCLIRLELEKANAQAEFIATKDGVTVVIPSTLRQRAEELN